MASALSELLTSAAERFPDNIAITGAGDELTYQELYRRSRELALELISAGVKPGTPVGLSIPKSTEAIVGAYGILLAGACYVPIDPFSPPQRAVRIAKNVELQAIVTTTKLLTSLVEEIAATCGPQIAFTPTEPPNELAFDSTARHWYAPKGQEADLPTVNDTDLAYVLHTSGSTGLPKGVAITHGNSLAFVDMAAEFFEITPGDRLCSQAPLHFDLSVFDLYVACRQAAAIVLIPEYYSAFPKKMVDAINRHEITVWNSVVSALTMMMERGEPERASFDSLRLVIFSGEAMPIKYLRVIRRLMPAAELINGYGQTEANTSMYYKIADIPDNDKWRIPIGQPFPGFEVFARGEDGGVIVRPGQEGELYVRANTVAQGYWNNADATADRFVEDPRSPTDRVTVYRTGDRVLIDENGNYLFVGRLDDMIKSRGYRIELGEIDQALLSCPGVEVGVAIAIPDSVVGNRIVAFVSPSSSSTITEVSVAEYCRNCLPAYMIPEMITVQAELPRTSTGKVDRRSLANTIPSNI